MRVVKECHSMDGMKQLISNSEARRRRVGQGGLMTDIVMGTGQECER